MAGNIATKTFAGGMNKDLDFSLVKDNQYYDALNYKLIADEDSNGFILENAEGNVLFAGNVSYISTYKIVGHCYIHPYLVLFYTTHDKDRSPSGGSCAIERITVDKDKHQSSEQIYHDGVSSTYLNLSTTYPITAVGHYESDDNIKVYWTDGYNNVRWMNIMDPNLSTYTADMFDLTPDFPVDTSSAVRPYFNSYIQGNIDCSSVQYTYRYMIPNGAATVWSPASAVVQVPAVDSINSATVKGGNFGENSGYGVSVDIDVVSSPFTKMQIAAIQYNTLNGVPTVRVFAERDLTASTSYTLNVSDVGTTLTQITYEDYLVQTNTSFKARDLEIKDNYLFAANIEETHYDVDVDCRAYRHDSGGDAELYESDLTTSITVNDDGVGGATIYANVPATHDCINLYNKSVHNSSNDENSNTYIFQEDGTTIGAEGLNVKVGIDLDETDIIDVLGTSGDNSWIATSFAYDPAQRGWQRNEVYRVGLILRNEKMQATPTKWVCDFKFPSVYEDSTDYSLTLGAGPYYSRRMGITVQWIGDGTSWADTGATSFEIVVVPRASEDRSILAQGILQPTYYDSGNTTYFPFHYMDSEDIIHASGSTNLCRLISPEISFNKNLNFQENDFIHYLGYFNWTSSNRLDQADGNTGTTLATYDKVFLHTSSDSSFANGKKNLIDDFAIVGYTSDAAYRTTIDSKTYKPYVEEIGAAGGESGCCTTHGVCSPTESMGAWWLAGVNADEQIPMFNYKRDVFASQYGGPDYYARQNNQYISVSDPKVATGGTPTAESYEGDTFIDWFFYNNACVDPLVDEEDTSASLFLFPVESSISLRHRLDEGLHQNIGNKNALLTQEIAGTHESAANYGVDTVAREWEQETALYQYNSAYSQQNYSAFYLADNADFEATVKYPTRIKRSEVKVNGEDFDSFTEFLPNNFIDLSGKHGPIHNLEIFNNNLYFWQNSGFGIASVNTRSLIQDNTPGVLALGTGGILDRVDYLSENVGNHSQFGIVKSGTSLYWADNNKNKFYRYVEGQKEPKPIDGIQTWINDNGRIGEVKAVYDYKYNDVIFTTTFSRTLDTTATSGDYATEFSIVPSTGLSTGSDYNAIIVGRYTTDTTMPYNRVLTYDTDHWELSENPTTSLYGDSVTEYYCTIDQDPTYTYTVTFNETVGEWVSRNSFTPGKYIGLDSTFVSTNDYNELYKHNDPSASRCTYYGVEYDSELTTVFNDKFPYTKTWDALKWHSESVDSDSINQFKNTFDKVTIYNDYQHTGDRDLYYKGDTAPGTRPTESIRRERTWSMQIPRNIVDTNVSSNPDITDSGNWDETQTFKERMRSKHIVVNFVYDNSNNYTFSIPFVSAIYRRSFR